MIIVDRALEERHQRRNPIRVAMVGAGFMGRGIALHILNYVKGMQLVAISNRHIESAQRAYSEAGVDDVSVVDSAIGLRSALGQGHRIITEDAILLAEAEGIDVLIEVTGAIEFSTRIVMKAIEYGKHVVTMTAELDGTIGPILKKLADQAGVIYTVSDGDQPGVIMNLHRFVRGIGAKPVLCGNIKGLHDPYRTPTTQAAFAAKWKQKPQMVTSFADGTKISFEQAIVANATNMRVAQRGMLGPTVAAGTPIDEISSHYPEDKLLAGPPIVDYVVGASPGPGVFVLATYDHPAQRHYLNLYKLGEGPIYTFYRPYHLCHFEVANSVARAALFQDATLAPLGSPSVEVVAAAKKDLNAGSMLDGLGCYMTYGLCENVATARAENLLPIGLAENCKLIRDVPKDQVLCFEDVEIPNERLCDKLWFEQAEHFKLNAPKLCVA